MNEQELDKLWGDVPFDPEKDMRSVPVPDGQYNVEIVAAVRGESKAGNPQITYQLRVVEGEHKGTEYAKYANMKTADNLFWVKKELVQLGVTDLPTNLTALDEVLKTLEGRKVMIEIITKNNFTNTYIREVVAG